MNKLAFFEAATPYWRDFHNSLAKDGFEIVYLTSEFESYCKGVESQLNFSPLIINKSKNTWLFSRLLKLIRDRNPRIVISIEYSLLTFQLWLIKVIFGYNYRLVTRCDDSIEMLEHPLTKTHKVASKFISRLVDDVVLCDKRTFDYYRKKYGKGIFFPIVSDDSVFRKELEDSLQIACRFRKEYSLSGKKVILFVGRLVQVKNIELLFDALKLAKIEESVVVIVGDGPLRNTLQEKAERCFSRVIFTGTEYGLNVKAWYSIADIFVLPSFHETFGAVVPEALMSGCYSLVSNAAGSAPLVQKGKTGDVFSPYSSQELADKLLFAINIISQEYGMRPSLMPQSYSEYYQELLQSLS